MSDRISKSGRYLAEVFPDFRISFGIHRQDLGCFLKGREAAVIEKWAAKLAPDLVKSRSTNSQQLKDNERLFPISTPQRSSDGVNN